MITERRDAPPDTPLAPGPPLTSAPLLVLVNSHTASASEIVAGALHDNCRAVLAGGRTYGKGLIQSVYELSDGSGLVITVGKYLTPRGTDIDRWVARGQGLWWAGASQSLAGLLGGRGRERLKAVQSLSSGMCAVVQSWQWEGIVKNYVCKPGAPGTGIYHRVLTHMRVRHYMPQVRHHAGLQQRAVQLPVRQRRQGLQADGAAGGSGRGRGGPLSGLRLACISGARVRLWGAAVWAFVWTLAGRRRCPGGRCCLRAVPL